MTYDQPPGGQPWSQQGQPDNPYPPQPPYQPQQQYPPGYPPPGYPPPGYPGGPRRRGRTALIVIGSILGSFVVIGVVAGIAGTSSHTVTIGQTGAAPVPPTAAVSPSSLAVAPVGSAITLAGNDDGEKMAVTVTRIISHAGPATDIDTPKQGDRLYAVQFRLANTGSTAYSDAPSNSAAVVDSAGQSYQASLSDAAGCASFPGTEAIAAGDKGIGCVAFEVPAAANITKVQFTLDSGFGPQTGQWEVRG